MSDTGYYDSPSGTGHPRGTGPTRHTTTLPGGVTSWSLLPESDTGDSVESRLECVSPPNRRQYFPLVKWVLCSASPGRSTVLTVPVPNPRTHSHLRPHVRNPYGLGSTRATLPPTSLPPSPTATSTN